MERGLTEVASLVSQHRLERAWLTVRGGNGLHCPKACGVFPEQGSNPSPLPWQVDSQRLDHREPCTEHLTGTVALGPDSSPGHKNHHLSLTGEDTEVRRDSSTCPKPNEQRWQSWNRNLALDCTGLGVSFSYGTPFPAKGFAHTQ